MVNLSKVIILPMTGGIALSKSFALSKSPRVCFPGIAVMVILLFPSLTISSFSHVSRVYNSRCPSCLSFSVAWEVDIIATERFNFSATNLSK